MTDQRSLPPELYTEEYFLNACEGYEEFSEIARRAAVAAAERGLCGSRRPAGHEACSTWAAAGAKSCATAPGWAPTPYGVDYAPVAVDMASQAVAGERLAPGKTGVAQSDAKRLPFPNAYFDRVLMFDVVEHLYPWELDQSLAEIARVLKPGGAFIVHTAPNVWYDRYAYPLVRLVRRALGQGARYPKNPRALNVSANVDVHVNEQSQWSLHRCCSRPVFGTCAPGWNRRRKTGRRMPHVCRRRA